ncbi:LysR family transcriptional regulator [Crenobacter cavernae]|uniref:LysR family transcriptional regulator n=1 Tax=Crenobacter cavernae TaxID=2290923 RepID=A0ABY0FHL6_9NEIS|nr:LysR family transcriptional regulator [Crenobacter cavernae]RXZ44376.1 LysR family transcriptional regulator [Crenobacter cavernae]
MDVLNAMRVFQAVAELGSFAAASERLNLSKGLASKTVGALEDRLGVRLLNRTTRRLSLTEAGAGYLARVASIVDAVDEAEAAAGRENLEPSGTLRVAAPVSFGLRHLSGPFAEFRRAHPKVALDVQLNDRRVDLVEEGFDVALRISRALPESSLVARALAPIRVALCASPEYLAARGVPQTLAELALHDCLRYSLSGAPDSWVFGAAGEIKVPVGGGVTANNGDVLVDAARRGLGLIYQPTFLVGEDLAAGRLVPLLQDVPTPTYRLYALYPHRRYLPSKVRLLIEHLAAEFGDAPYWDRA